MEQRKQNGQVTTANAFSPVAGNGNGNERAVHASAKSDRLRSTAIALAFLGSSVAVFIVHFLFFRHSFPPINVDEASFFSPAQSFAQKGDLGSDVHKNFLPGADTHTYWMPPLYIVALGLFFKIFGSTVTAAKVFSLLLTVASAVLITRLGRDRFTKAAAAALFLICPFVLARAAFIRVEALAILITIAAIVGVKKRWSAPALGVVAALGIMTHPLMLACAAGLGLVALRRGVKPLLIFSLAFAVAVSPYLWYILQDVEAFKVQMALQFSRKAGAGLFDLKLDYLMQSVPMVVLALFCLYKTKAETELRVFLSVSVLLALVAVLRSNEVNYQIYLVPYTIAALALAMDRGVAMRSLRWAAPLVLYGFFAGLLALKLKKYAFRTDADFNQLVTHLNAAPLYKGKTTLAVGGPDVSAYLMMQGEEVERQIPVPQELPAAWFDKYNHVIEIKENGSPGENGFEEAAKPWRSWKASAFTTADSAYTLTQYTE